MSNNSADNEQLIYELRFQVLKSLNAVQNVIGLSIVVESGNNVDSHEIEQLALDVMSKLERLERHAQHLGE